MRVQDGPADRVLTSSLLLILVSALVVSAAYANVPEVLEDGTTKDGDNTILLVKVRHLNPSSTHYVDIVEIDLDGKIIQVTGLKPQDAEEFEFRNNLGEVSGTPKIRVRAHCNVHGWNSWYELGGGAGSSGIPGFPWEAIAIGILGASYPLLKRHTG